MHAPVVAALAVLGADVGVARVSKVAAVLHTDLQALGHVDIGHVGGRLTHADALREGAVSKEDAVISINFVPGSPSQLSWGGGGVYTLHIPSATQKDRRPFCTYVSF